MQNSCRSEIEMQGRKSERHARRKYSLPWGQEAVALWYMNAYGQFRVTPHLKHNSLAFTSTFESTLKTALINHLNLRFSSVIPHSGINKMPFVELFLFNKCFHSPAISCLYWRCTSTDEFTMPKEKHKQFKILHFYVLVKKYSYFLPLTITLPALCISSSSSGSTASIIECSGLLNDFFPFLSVQLYIFMIFKSFLTSFSQLVWGLPNGIVHITTWNATA